MADQTLRPGFRFAPTDEELINYYLKPKVLGEEYPLDVIQEIDVTNFEPWDLLGESRECYYFTSLDKKYINGKKTNRTTRNGFWKTTGRDTPIRSNGQVVGTRKILVFHRGRSKDKKRTNWVMHEFSLGQTTQDSFVICKVFLKSEEARENKCDGGEGNEQLHEDTEVGLAKALILLQHMRN